MNASDRLQPVTTDGAVIASIAVRRIPVPLRRSWGEDVTSLTYIETIVTDVDGARGYGFTWTPSIGAAAVVALLENDIGSWLPGRPTSPRLVWEPLWRHLHELGGGGVTTIAMAGVDTALWDLESRRAGQSLTDALGFRRASLPAYGSGVNLHYSIDELADQAERWVNQGFQAVKVKVGSPDLKRDVERLRVVRDVIGDERTLMIDANQRWDLDRAVTAMSHLAAFGPAWIEEPLRADDLDGYRRLSSQIDVPIACGENVYTRYRFAEFATSGAVAVLQPNLVRIGGITPLAGIAADAGKASVDIALHLLPELSAQVAASLPHETSVEVVDGATLTELGALSGPSPISVVGGRVEIRRRPGLDLHFRDDSAVGRPDDGAPTPFTKERTHAHN